MELDDDFVQHPAIYVQVEYRAAAPEQALNKTTVGARSATQTSADAPDRDGLVCTVKVECPQGHVTTETRVLSTKIGSFKTHLAQLVDLSADALTIWHQNRPLSDDQPFDHFARPHESINLFLTSNNPTMHPIRINPVGHLLLPVPDVITVRVKDKSGRSRDVVIEIENRCARQPFLGGWRWKQTGLEVYHASTQTDISAVNKIRILQANEINTQDMQVTTISHKETQTGVGVSCQVRPFEWMNLSSTHSEIRSRRFVPADQANDAAIVLQRNFRSWMEEKKVTHQIEEKIDEDLDVSVDQTDVVKERDQRHCGSLATQSDAVAFMEPVDSFIDHYNPLTMAVIDSSPHKKMEYRIFHDLEQLNAMRSSASKDRLMQRLLQKVTQPKLWKSATTGETIQVDTAEIEQLRDTKHVYEAICNSTLTEERVRALHLLKRTLEKESGTTVKEILQLVDRELNLLSRGMMSSTLSGLQSRLRALLRRYIQTKLPQE